MPVDVSTNQQAAEKIVPLGTKNGIELAICGRTEKTLGKIIAKADSPDLIEGVRIEPLQVYPDDRGFFTELAQDCLFAVKCSAVGPGRPQIEFWVFL